MTYESYVKYHNVTGMSINALKTSKGETVMNPRGIAEILNTQFSSVFVPEADYHSCAPSSCLLTNSHLRLVRFDEVNTACGVYHILLELIDLNGSLDSFKSITKRENFHAQ